MGGGLLFLASFYSYQREREHLERLSYLKDEFFILSFQENELYLRGEEPSSLLPRYRRLARICTECHRFEEDPFANKLEKMQRFSRLFRERQEVEEELIALLTRADILTREMTLKILPLSSNSSPWPFAELFDTAEAIRRRFLRLLADFWRQKGEGNLPAGFSQKLENFEQFLKTLESSLPEANRSFCRELRKLLQEMRRLTQRELSLHQQLLVLQQEINRENERFLRTANMVHQKVLAKVHRLRLFNLAAFVLLFAILAGSFTVGFYCVTALLKDLRTLKKGAQHLQRDLSTPIRERLFFVENDELRRILNDFASSLASHIEQLRTLLEETKALSRELRKFALAVAQSPVGIILTDRGGVVEYVNRAYANLCGYPPEEMQGKELPFRDLLHDGKTVVRELTLTTKSGEIVWVEALISPVRDEEGGLTHYLVILRDITAEKKLEEKQELLARLEILALTAGGLAHDFNNLLAAILGYLELGLSQPGKCPRYAEKARSLCLKGRDFTNRLLAITKGHLPEKRRVNLRRVLEEAAEVALKGTACELVLELTQELPPLYGDRHQLLQVFQNLFINAVEAMGERGRILVRARRVELSTGEDGLPPGTYLHIEVADEGPGIPAEIREKVFQPFFSTKEGGTGLGLATVYSVVRRHGGRITVHEAPGGGALFEILLPAGAGSPEGEAPSEQKEASLCGEDLCGKALVVEDEDLLREGLKEMLEFCGLEVFEAKEAEEAFKLFQSYYQNGGCFDLAVVDLHLTGHTDGLSLLKRLRELDSTLPTLLISGREPTELPSNNVLFLKKPFTFEELQLKLRELFLAREKKEAEK